MSIEINVQANVLWNAAQSTSSNRWVAVCDALNLSTEAETLDELHSVIGETLHVFMLDLMLEGELDDYLREHGWSRQGPSRVEETDDVDIRVPFELIAAGRSSGTERFAH